MPPGDQAILAVIHDAVRAERSNLMTNAPTYEVILTDAPDTRAKTVIGEGLATPHTIRAILLASAIASLKRLSRRAAASIQDLRPYFSQLCGRSSTARAA